MQYMLFLWGLSLLDIERAWAATLQLGTASWAACPPPPTLVHGPKPCLSIATRQIRCLFGWHTPKKTCYTAHRLLRSNERLARERGQQGRAGTSLPQPGHHHHHHHHECVTMMPPSATGRNHPSPQTKGRRRRSVTLCSGDYVATDSRLTKG
jgi:hypothetical protein